MIIYFLKFFMNTYFELQGINNFVCYIREYHAIALRKLFLYIIFWGELAQDQCLWISRGCNQSCTFLDKLDCIYLRNIDSERMKNGPWTGSNLIEFWQVWYRWKALNLDSSTTIKSSKSYKIWSVSSRNFYFFFKESPAIFFWSPLGIRKQITSKSTVLAVISLRLFPSIVCFPESTCFFNWPSLNTTISLRSCRTH